MEPEWVDTFSLIANAIGIPAIIILVIKTISDRKKYKQEVARSSVETGGMVTEKLMEGSDWLENKFRTYIADLEKKVDQHEQRIKQLEDELNKETGLRKSVQEELDRKEGTIQRQNNRIITLESEIDTLKAENKLLNSKNSELILALNKQP